MPNINLTPDMITDKALEVLHQKLNFCGNIVRDYDDSFANEGAKIGNTLRVRQPIQYNTGTGATMATGTGADTKQTSTTLTVSSQRHVPMRFTSQETSMDIDDFSASHIEPAMSKLAAMIENDAFNMVDEVANVVHAGTKVDFSELMEGRANLMRELAPGDDRCALLDVQANADLVDALKGLFQDSSTISKQNREGILGRTAGFDFYENTILPSHTVGTEGAGTAYLVNDTAAGVVDISSSEGLTQGTPVVDTGTLTITEGDGFTIANVYECHPETKQSTGVLRKFVVLADATGAGTLSVAPNIITGGAYQNVDSVPANSAKLTFLGVASTAYKQSLLFQKGFACFATADLYLPKGVSMASRRVYDGISMRLLEDYDIVKDRKYIRMDVLYGFKVLRPGLACRILHT